MLLASSNNKAVENVSAELPGLDAIADDAKDLRFFKTVSDKLLGRETWGFLAAVLGNAKNRGAFRQTFWWDDDVGMYRYLAHASGTPQSIKEKNPETGETITRRPRIVVDEDAPKGHREALQRWQRERKRFAAALRVSQLAQNQLADMRDYLVNRDGLKEGVKRAQDGLKSHKPARPGWLSRLLRTSRYKAWARSTQST